MSHSEGRGCEASEGRLGTRQSTFCGGALGLWVRYPVMFMGAQVLVITTRLLTRGPLEVLTSLTQCRNCSWVVMDGRQRQVDLY